MIGYVVVGIVFFIAGFFVGRKNGQSLTAKAAAAKAVLGLGKR